MLYITPGDPEAEAMVAQLARAIIGDHIAASVTDETERDALLIELERELAGRTDPAVVRRNCAYCGRERSRADDNHSPSCAYWRFVRAAQGILEEDR